MKMKKIRLLTLLLALPVLAGCSDSYLYTPRNPYPGPDPEVKEFGVTINFYLDNTHSEEPLFSMEWYLLEPLGECPKEALLTDANAPDPLYPKFLGYSEYSSSIDEDHIWDFSKDYIQQGPIFSLYGIWASK